MKILYIHNKEDWAIHNVGKLWLHGQNLHIKTDFINYRDIKDVSLFERYNFVWFGYYFIYTRYNYNPEKSIVAIHDPMELFPETPGWKAEGIISERLSVLKKLSNIITISTEMHDLLLEYKIQTTLLNTTSILPYRNLDDIKTNKCDASSVFQVYPRKNPELLNEIKADIGALGVNLYLKTGLTILPEKDYIKLLDKHEVYICTSYQEGGPLPAMDAMKRGAVVLTTPVGQIQELIINDSNGYICNTKNEFVSKLKLLSADKNKLHQMRLRSIQTIKDMRNEDQIRDKVDSFLNQL